MQKFILPDIDYAPSKGMITGQDAKHAAKVLRMAKGTQITVSNGRGKDFSARILCVSRNAIELEIIDELKETTESPIDITLCSGLLKDNKMDFVIKHATQLGITRWIPFFSERSIPTPDAKRLKTRVERWNAIAAESLKQCRRSRLPEISDTIGFERLLTLTVPSDLKLIFFEKDSLRPGTLKSGKAPGSIIILIGPEGGFSENEVDQARSAGFVSCSLGPRILRAETAAISSCTLVQHLFGDL